MDRDHLEALRRQVEEDYRLDIAAIERLQRRYPDASSQILSGGMAGSGIPTSVDPAQNSGSSAADSRRELRATVLPSPMPTEPRKDELTDSLRSMFSANRR